MGGKKGKGQGKEGFRSKVMRLEGIYGREREFIFEKYPSLLNYIGAINFQNNFIPKVPAGRDPLVHPFLTEIREFRVHPGFLRHNPPGIPEAPTTFHPTWIDSEKHLMEMVNYWMMLPVIFIDLEGHSARSYRGITPLIQINDEKKVYFIDTLALYQKMGHMRKLFTNPNVIKVFHGGDNDVKWLQRDFSIFVIGLIDLQKLYRVWADKNGELHGIQSGTANIGYKDLVNGFISLDQLDKGETFTDFRQRPLHPEQVKYAYLDVFYMPYLFMKMMIEISADGVRRVVTLSVPVALQQYKHPSLDLGLPETKLYHLMKLRDLIARKTDHNPEFLCPKSALENMAKNGLSPRISPQPLPFFLEYSNAIAVALLGRDPTTVLETEYANLHIRFPFEEVKYCFGCGATGHYVPQCNSSKEEQKAFKAQHYIENPAKRQHRTQALNRKKRSTAQKRHVMNQKTNRRHNNRFILRHGLSAYRAKLALIRSAVVRAQRQEQQ